MKPFKNPKMTVPTKFWMICEDFGANRNQPLGSIAVQIDSILCTQAISRKDATLDEACARCDVSHRISSRPLAAFGR